MKAKQLVHLLLEVEKAPSTWATVTAIAAKIGCTPEVLRVWYQKYLDQQNLIKSRIYLTHKVLYGAEAIGAILPIASST